MISKKHNEQMGSYLAKLAETQNNLGTWQERIIAEHKPTNADRIRAMSDEELAEWIDNDVAFWGKWCPNDAPVNPVTHECMRNGGECRLCILDWLKEEIGDG